MSQSTLDLTGSNEPDVQGVRMPSLSDYTGQPSNAVATDGRHQLRLRGCSPAPLGNYLKAIGLLRVVAEQVDPSAQGTWVNDTFVLTSTLDSFGVVDFLLNRYSPTPIVGPWGGRSGFYPETSEKSAREALEWIMNSPEPRFADFHETVVAARRTMHRLGIVSKPSGEDERRLVQGLRSTLPDRAVSYLDATYLLVGEGNRVLPALMGTGGNVGSGSFFSNFMQSLVNVFSLPLEDEVRASLFAETSITSNASRQDTGHLLPAGSRGENGSSAGDAASAASGSDSWDLLLGLEGSIAFAGSAARSMTGGGARPRAPFTLRYSADAPGEGRDGEESWAQELILPLWDQPCSWNELQLLIAEGRLPAEKNNMATLPAALTALRKVGMQRGVTELIRYKFPQRAGQKNLAIESGRYSVSVEPKLAWVAPALNWIEGLRSSCEAKEAPASIRTRYARLAATQTALLAQQSFEPATLSALMVGMSELQSQMVTSWRWTSDKVFRRPAPLLSQKWLVDTCDDSAEFWLAASLASLATPTRTGAKKGEQGVRLDWRGYLAPIDLPRLSSKSAQPAWKKEPSNDHCWVSGDVIRGMHAVFHRRLLQHDSHVMRFWEMPADSQSAPTSGPRFTPAPLWAIQKFIEGRFDDARFEQWLRCAMLVKPGFDLLSDSGLNDSFAGVVLSPTQRRASVPPLAWMVLKLCFAGHSIALSSNSDEGVSVPIDRTIVSLLQAGDARRGVARAIQRLRGSRIAPAFPELPVPAEWATRLAAALLFPLRKEAVQSILLPAVKSTSSPAPDAVDTDIDSLDS
jgi:CRISPR-associated protein Csx17